MTKKARDLKLKPITYVELAGWADDNHAAAFGAFKRSCRKMTSIAKARLRAGGKHGLDEALLGACGAALEKGAGRGRDSARTFFESNFTPRTITANRGQGLLTAYFEPELTGSRKRVDGYDVPIYRRPDDLVMLFAPAERGTRNAEITAMRKTAQGHEPYPTRAEIEQGALSGRDLELLYLKDPIDTYIMHIQGSARIRLKNGKKVRFAFAAKNGHPYTSIGKALIDLGEIDAASMSMERLKAWLRAHPEKAKKMMWKNRSFIFFKELDEREGADGPIGAQGVALSPGRSLAVDTGFHNLGTPIWVSVAEFKASDRTFARLMIAQDVGSAIQGPERGDIFWGSGEEAGLIAGTVKYPGAFTILVPNGGTPF